MWSLSLVMSECSISERGQGHVSNFYIVDLENVATASRRYTGDIHKSSVVGLFMTHLRQWKRLGRVIVECTLSITHCIRLNLQLHTIDLVRTCRISSFCTVAWQLARFQLTRSIARSLGDSWASCCFSLPRDTGQTDDCSVMRPRSSVGAQYKWLSYSYSFRDTASFFRIRSVYFGLLVNGAVQNMMHLVVGWHVTLLLCFLYYCV